MGFLTVGRRFLNNPHDIIDDRIDVLTRGTMGLTVTCARCHDHKYDPIPTKDYYSLYGVLASSVEPKDRPTYMTLADAEQPVDAARLRARQPRQSRRRRCRGSSSRSWRATVGNRSQQGSGRLELAEAIASPDNPLTARVIVNRIWMYYFEQPLVDTPSDFGLRSEPPTHPGAARLPGRDAGRERLVAQEHPPADPHFGHLSAGERRSARRPRRSIRRIGLLWRMNRKRLDFEVAARLRCWRPRANSTPPSADRPSICSTQPWPTRRTLYGRIDRQNLPNLFRTFDFASPDTHSPQRLHDHRAAAGAVTAEQPVRARAGAAAGGAAEFAGEADASVRIERCIEPRSCEAGERELALGRRSCDEGASSARRVLAGSAANRGAAAVPPRMPSRRKPPPAVRLGTLRPGRAAVERVRVCRLTLEDHVPVADNEFAMRPEFDNLVAVTRAQMLLRAPASASARWRWANCWAARGCSTRSRRPTRSIRCCPSTPHFPAKAKRVIHLFMNGGPSHVDTFDPKPELDQVRTARRCPMQPADRAQDRRGVRLAVQVPEVRPERHRGQRAVPAHAPSASTTSCVIRSMHADVAEPRAVAAADELRRGAADPAQHGLVGHLRPGHREPEPARLHRDVPRRLSDPGVAELAGGVSARRLPGHVHRHQAHARSTS